MTEVAKLLTEKASELINDTENYSEIKDRTRKFVTEKALIEQMKFLQGFHL